MYSATESLERFQSGVTELGFLNTRKEVVFIRKGPFDTKQHRLEGQDDRARDRRLGRL